MSQTVIVFQEDCILAAEGKEGKYPLFSRLKRLELQGQGDSFERWKTALLRLQEDWEIDKARLVLPAGLTSTRVLQLPNSRGKQLVQMASRELEDSFRNEVADYSILHMDKKSNVDLCAGGVDSTNLEQFLGICEEADIAVAGITVPMDAYLRVLKYHRSDADSTAIYLFFEEGSMTSVLWQNGGYLYSSRSRLFSEPGTLDFGTEIVRSTSGILQFYAGTGKEQQITQVYYAGCPAEDFEVSVEGIRNLNLDVYPMEVDRRVHLPSGANPPDWLPCIGAMVRGGRKEKQIDLYQMGLKREEKEAKGKKKIHVGKILLMPICTFGACFLLTIILVFMNLGTIRKIYSSQEWMQNPSVQEDYARAMKIEEELKELENGRNEVNLLEENRRTYPVFSGSLLRRIEAVGGAGMELLITDYDVETGVLQFNASSKEVINTSEYVRNLQETGLFHEVDYTGYTLEDEWYTLSLSCTLEGTPVMPSDADSSGGADSGEAPSGQAASEEEAAGEGQQAGGAQ